MAFRPTAVQVGKVRLALDFNTYLHIVDGSSGLFGDRDRHLNPLPEPQHQQRPHDAQP